MRKRKYSKKKIAWICLMSIAMLAAAILLNKIHPLHPTSEDAVPMEEEESASSGDAVQGQASGAAGELEQGTVMDSGDIPEDRIATFLQGPKSWKARREWSGKWGKTMYDGGSFGGFGCGLCCLANIYCSLTPYRCSPVEVYRYAKKHTEYAGGGAIDWGYMKQTLQNLGFTCQVGKKPKNYSDFQQLAKQSLACIAVVSSKDSKCYWKDTPGHYVTLFLYNEETDEVFLGDSGDPNHNRHWIPLKYVYKSMKMENYRQYLMVTSYDSGMDQWKHIKIGGKCVLPARWQV